MTDIKYPRWIYYPNCSEPDKWIQELVNVFFNKKNEKNIRIYVLKINDLSPPILEYIVIVKYIVKWFIFKQRSKGKIDDIRKYKNIHIGKRCFIAGNGPSINKTNFNLIKDEIIIATNQLYKAKKDLNINVTYYITDNKYLIETCYDDFCNIDKKIFLGQTAAVAYGKMLSKGEKEFKNKPVAIRNKIKHMWHGKEMPTNIEKGFADGATVVIGGLQLAFYMGFKEVYLLGCDCDFSKQGHFYDEPLESYEKEIIEVPRWFESYKMCKKAYKKDGRKIINATVGGKLEVFKRQSLEEIMGKGEND